jgi:hypothetical protein
MTVCLRQAVFVPPSVCVVADELGIYADMGVDIETVLVESSTDQRDRLLSGNVDVGVTAMDNLLVWNADGGDLRIVAQVESTTPLGLVARPSVTGVQGLRGAVLGVDAVNNGFAVVLRPVGPGPRMTPSRFPPGRSAHHHQKFEDTTYEQQYALLPGNVRRSVRQSVPRHRPG